MNQYFPKLFTPGNIGLMKVANRIIMPAMGTNFPGATGEVTDALMAYHEARAKGGTGLIIVEHANVDYPRGQGGATHLRIDDDAFIPGFHNLVEKVHRWGARVCIQVNHVGGAGRKTTGGTFAPSAVPMAPDRPVPKELSLADIADIIEKFGQAAARVKRAGFDAVEIHGAHIYLISQFLSPFTNRRTDEYGGDLNRRMKFALDVVRRVRAAVGKDFPILFRLNGDDFMADGMTLAESKVVARTLEQASVDALDITGGGPLLGPSRTWACRVEPMSYPQGWKSYLAREIKKCVSIPVIAAGVIREPEFAEGLLQKGEADFIAMGRALIADPEWSVKSRGGRSAAICKCISCLACLDYRGTRGWQLRCAVNAAAGRERELSHLPAITQVKQVCVIGGGPAGMECARIAARRGHRVSLYEKETNCGGQVRLASVPPGKDKLRWLLDYLAGECKAAGVDVHANHAVTGQELRKMKCDVAVVATGATPLIPKELLQTRLKTVTAHDILAGKAVITKQKVIILGGGISGCETANYLAKDNNITIIEATGEAALGMQSTSRWDLLNTLGERQVPIRLNTKALEIVDEGVLVSTNGGKSELLRCDIVVLALGVQSVNDLARELEDKVPELYVIGDANSPGKIIDAIYDGNTIGRSI